MECRVYGKKNVEKQGDMWVVSHQQALMDISQEQGNCASMIAEANKKRLDAINEQLYTDPEFHAAAAHVERRAKHAETTHALICLGLQRFENAFARKRARRTIPPGWFDICSTGLKAALLMPRRCHRWRCSTSTTRCGSAATRSRRTSRRSARTGGRRCARATCRRSSCRSSSLGPPCRRLRATPCRRASSTTSCIGTRRRGRSPRACRAPTPSRAASKSTFAASAR